MVWWVFGILFCFGNFLFFFLWIYKTSYPGKHLRRQRKLRVKEDRKLRRRSHQDERLKRRQRDKVQQLKNSLTVEERKQFYQEKRLQEIENKLKLERAQENKNKNHIQVAVDLSFAEQQSRKECNSIAKQLAITYGSMKYFKEEHLISLHFSGINDLDLIDACNKQGISNWKVNQHLDNFQTIFKNRNIVYLTPDSSNVIDTFDKDIIYVVGGIVDCTVRKNQTLKVAQTLNIKTARLPLKEYATPGKRVLNIDMVLKIIMKYNQYQNWDIVFKDVFDHIKK